MNVFRHRYPALLIFLLLTTLYFGSTSCDQAAERPPLSEDSMAAVLLDMQLAETYSLGLGADSDAVISRFARNYDSLSVFYSAILAHHHLTFDRFNEAMAWYKSRPGKCDTLFSKVLEQMTLRMTEQGIPAEHIEDGERPVSQRPLTAPRIKEDSARDGVPRADTTSAALSRDSATKSFSPPGENE